MDDLINFMVEKEIASISDIQGYSELEISTFENLNHVSLPSIYRDYLLAIGKKHGDLFGGASVYLEHYDFCKKDFLTQIEQYSFQVSEKYFESGFLFYANRGYDFQFFYLDQTDNDPRIFWVNDQNTEEFTGLTFTRFLWRKAHEVAEIITSTKRLQ
jgi:hypothetical protein